MDFKIIEGDFSDLTPPEKELFNAIQNLDIEKVKNLLSAKVNSNVKTKRGYTPLHLLAVNRTFFGNEKSEAIAKELISKGADIFVTDNEGNTALHYMAMYAGGVNKVIADSKIFDIKNNQGEAALTVSIKYGIFSVTDYLIDNKANLNIQDKDGCTAYHLAAKSRLTSIMDRLTIAGADTTIKDKDRKTGDNILQEKNTRPVSTKSSTSSTLKNAKPLLVGLVCAGLAIAGIAIFGVVTAGISIASIASVAGIALVAETVTASIGIPGIIAATVVSFFGGALFGKLIDKISCKATENVQPEPTKKTASSINYRNDHSKTYQREQTTGQAR